MTENSDKPKLKHSLGLLDGTMIVSGSMIGSGIFIVSADIIRNVGSAGWLIVVWAITGFMTLTAAVSYGELSAMFPKAGGQYVYLKEAYNPLTGFLYGWSFFAVIQTATIAANDKRSCDLARTARDAFNLASINLPAGGQKYPNEAAQLLTAIPQFTPAVDNEVKRFCK